MGMKKLTKQQRRVVRTLSFPVVAMLMMTTVMAIAAAQRPSHRATPVTSSMISK